MTEAAKVVARILGRSPSHPVVRAVAIAVQHGGHDGEHHKAWVIDQMVRILAGGDYQELVAAARDGEDGPETYDWDEGVAP